MQGHVDCTAKILSITASGHSKIISIKFPEQISQYLAFKGSIAVSGVSLTISKLLEDHFMVSLIPYTLKTTNLGLLRVGNTVNLEIDLIARYLERLVQSKEQETKFQWLKDRNFI